MRGAVAFAALLALAGVANAESDRQTPALRVGVLDVVLGSPAQELLLDVWLNGKPRRMIANVISSGQSVKLLCANFAQFGIRIESWECAGRDRIDISALAGVRAEIDMPEQRLLLTAEPGRVAPNTIELRGSETAADWGAADFGFIAEYDVAGTANDLRDLRRTTSIGADLALTTFTPYGTLTTTGFATTADEDRAIRLDTRIEIDDPSRLRQFAIGDSILGGLRWSRPVRFGGISLVSDFSLQPDFVTMPLPDFFGDAPVPGSIDVLIGATRVFQGNVDSGPFQLRDLPVLSGSGDVSVVLRDSLGRETRTTFTAYGSAQILKEGLAAYALDVGFLRRSYGVKSIDYGDLAGSGTLRFGVTDEFTLEAHTEVTDNLAVAGGGVLSLSPFGIIEAAGAFSTGSAGEGGLLAASFESRGDPITLFGSLVLTTRDYTDIASVEGTASARRRLQLGGNVSLGEFGTLAASWIERKDSAGERAKLATLSYSLSGIGGWYLGATAFYDDINGESAGELFFSIPLTQEGVLSASTRRDEDAHTHRLAYDVSADPDGGFGWHVAAEAGAEAKGEAGLAWYGQHLTMSAELAANEDHAGARASARGALVAVDGSLFAAKQSSGAYALVRAGREDVRVLRENRNVASTDVDGEVLLAGLTAYAPNRVTVDGRDFPMSDVLDGNERIVAPRRRSVAIVNFTPHKGRPALVTVKLPGGDYPPAGADVLLKGATDVLVVGHHGLVFFADLTETARGVIQIPTGRCRFEVVPPPSPSADEIPKVGPVTCQPEERAK